ncbi:MAG: DNA gyrase subunit A [Candidatus Aenigmarchaeota archaeon]|nr:DNA gyrase subunit A [Candidatus Aenigmarchaeota archaeon]
MEEVEKMVEKDGLEETPKIPEKIKPVKPGQVIDRVIEDEMKESYLDYSMSVIVGRALPDVCDGLKPVHRRVLYTMWENGLLHNKPFRKSANVVGTCMANYHPHGDSAIYDTLVRMAQDFSLRYPLVNGQGNFGSIDGDAAAAMRYTEARMASIAEELLRDIEKNTVPFVPNFDGSTREPLVLPSKIPNLLINGSSGIAVGMATNIPPHNLEEVCNAVVASIENPGITTRELMGHIPGPDFPTGGELMGKNGILKYYETGRGRLVVRGTAEIEEKKGRETIIIKEIPYQVNKTALIENIVELVKDKKIEGISNLRDESDRDGMRIVIELKKDANSDVILNNLFKHTPLQSTFGVIMLALVNNQPKVMGLREIIDNFVVHRRVVVRKRTEFELLKAEDRAHILEGLIIALDNIDAVVELIKKSKDVPTARQGLMSTFGLTEIQANAILDMKLSRLTNLEQDKVRQELEELRKLIDKLKAILADENEILKIIKEELLEMKQKYSDKRRTMINNAMEFEEIDDESLIDEEDVVITISEDDYIKRLPIEEYRIQNRGGKGIIGAKTKEGDIISDCFITNTHSYILFFTDKGKVYWLKAYNIPDSGRYSRGKAIVNLINLEEGETIKCFIPIRTFEEEKSLVMVTKKGTVKKSSLMDYSRPRVSGIRAVTLKEDDELRDAFITDGHSDIMIATKSGLCTRFDESEAREIGRTGSGVRGIRLSEGDEVVGACTSDITKSLLTMTENGYGKRTEFTEYNTIHRGGKGVINIKTTDRNGNVVYIKPVLDTDEILVMTKNGQAIRIPVEQISKIGRNTQGVRIMKLDEGDKVVSFTRFEKMDGDEETENSEPSTIEKSE